MWSLSEKLGIFCRVGDKKRAGFGEVVTVSSQLMMKRAREDGENSLLENLSSYPSFSFVLSWRILRAGRALHRKVR